MEKDRDQLTPDDPEDAEHLASHRGQGTAGSGRDQLSESVPIDDLTEGEVGGTEEE